MQLPLTVSEFVDLAIDVKAAADFIRGAPYSLEELQLSGDFDDDLPELLAAFIRHAKEADRASNWADIPKQHKAVDAMDAVVHRMDAMEPPRRTALTVLFDHEHDAVRTWTANYLADIMPERVLPILKEVETFCVGSSRMTACFAVFRIEGGHKVLSPELIARYSEASQNGETD